MLDSVVIGNKIVELRKKAHMSQETLANNLFITRQGLSKYELGLIMPSIETVLLLSKIFKVSVEEILCFDDKVEIDPTHLFQNHSREFIINKIINNEIAVDLCSLFKELSYNERLLILKNIKEGKTKASLPTLKSVLTISEIKYLEGGNE